MAEEILAFASVEDAENAIKAYEIQTNNKFTVLCNTFNFRRVKSIDVESLRNFVIRFEDKRGKTPIHFDGVPFILIGTEVRECVYGPQRSKKKKIKLEEPCYTQTRILSDKLLLKSRKKKRPKKFVSKKINCPAQIYLRVIIRFPDFKINGPPSKRSKANLVDIIRSVKSFENVKQELRVLVCIGNNHNDHSTERPAHPVDNNAAMNLEYQQEMSDMSVVPSVENVVDFDPPQNDNNLLKLKLSLSPRKKVKRKANGGLPQATKICKVETHDDSFPEEEEEEETLIIQREIHEETDVIPVNETLNALASIQETTPHESFINCLKSQSYPQLDLRPVINHLNHQQKSIARLEKEVLTMRKNQEKQSKTMTEMLELMKTIVQSQSTNCAAQPSEVIVSEPHSGFGEDQVIYDSLTSSLQAIARKTNPQEHYVIHINSK